MSEVLQARGLRVTVTDGTVERVVLDDVDLELRAGEIAVVTGRSGSGKSTLLSLVGLLRRPPAGEVTIGGTATSGLSGRARTRLRGRDVGIVYQSANLVPNLTGIEQLELVSHVRGERIDPGSAERMLETLGVGHCRDRLPQKMSGGERQRVGIARALAGSPLVLLADEPTAALDQELAVEVSELIAEQARQRSIATLIVTHDSAPMAVADRHLHLAGGSLAEQQSATAQAKA